MREDGQLWMNGKQFIRLIILGPREQFFQAYLLRISHLFCYQLQVLLERF